ncbi:HD domain-containing protein [bacterium]|nr:HD domain-containing protein [bacterium]
MQKKSLILILLISLLAVFMFISKSTKAEDIKQITPYEVDVYSSDNGIPTGEANAVFQTSDGYVWIGGYGGLQKYDGVSFELISGTMGLSSHNIRSLYQDKNGIFWVGSNDQGAFYLDGNEFKQPEQDLELNKHSSIRCFMEDSFDRIWIGTYDGIAYIENNKVINYNLEQFSIDGNPYRNSTFYTLSLKDDYLYGVDYNGNVVIINTKNISETPIIVKDFGASTYAYSALMSSDSTLYVGTSSNKLFIIKNPGKENETRTTIENEVLRETNHIIETESHEIWICGANGLSMINGGEFYDYSYLKYTSNLEKITEDYEHNLWIASSKYGVIHVRKTKIMKVANVDEIEDKETYTISKYQNRYYVGSEDNILVFDENWNKIEDNPLSNAINPGTHVHHIVSGGGKLYVGTHYKGLYIYDGETDTIDVNIPATEFSDQRIRCLLYSSDNKLYIGTGKAVEVVENGVHVKTIDTGTMILCLNETNDGKIIAGTNGKGIYEIKEDTYVPFESNKDLSSGVILRIKNDTNSNNLFVSCGYDTYYGTSSSFTKLNIPEYGSGSVVDFFADNESLWVFRASGIIKISKEELINNDKEHIKTNYFARYDGLPGPLIANSFSFHEGTLFIICTTNGIGIFDEATIYKNNAKPKVQVKSMTFSDGQEWDGTDTVKLDKNLSKLSITLAALSFTGEDTRAEYWLEGFDTEPKMGAIADQRTIEYTNLGPGTYVFHFRALNSDNLYGDEIVITFIKSPKFQETIWFPLTIMIIAAVATFLIFFIIARVRIKRIEKKEEEYKKITDETIATISGAIDAKDPYTEGHSKRVADFSVKIGQKLGLNEEDLERLYYIALLHDIGKIGVPDDILKKPARLTDEEFETIKRHTVAGGDILKNFTMLKGVDEGAKYHHERYDGSGYCYGLKGEDIPLFARIISVADAYDAMNSSRCYRKALDIDIIKSELEKGKGRQFDPKLADIAISLLNEEKQNA